MNDAVQFSHGNQGGKCSPSCNAHQRRVEKGEGNSQRAEAVGNILHVLCRGELPTGRASREQTVNIPDNSSGGGLALVSVDIRYISVDTLRILSRYLAASPRLPTVSFLRGLLGVPPSKYFSVSILNEYFFGPSRCSVSQQGGVVGRADSSFPPVEQSCCTKQENKNTKQSSQAGASSVQICWPFYAPGRGRHVKGFKYFVPNTGRATATGHDVGIRR